MKRYCFILFFLAILLSCKKQDVQPAESAVSVDNAETVKSTVSFISPHAGDTLHDSIVIKVMATDASGIAQVLIKIDGVKLEKPDKVAPYEFGWNTRKVVNGHHIILTKATDIFNNSRSKSIDVIVNNRDTIRDTIIILPVERDLVDLINAERRSRSLPELRIDTSIVRAARNHSQDEADNFYFGHTGSDGNTLGTRLDAVGYPWVTAGENLAAGQTTGQQVFDAWMGNAGQRSIMLNGQFLDVGIGVVPRQNETDAFDTYWTGDFGSTVQ